MKSILKKEIKEVGCVPSKKVFQRRSSAFRVGNTPVSTDIYIRDFWCVFIGLLFVLFKIQLLV